MQKEDSPILKFTVHALKSVNPFLSSHYLSHFLISKVTLVIWKLFDVYPDLNMLSKYPKVSLLEHSTPKFVLRIDLSHFLIEYFHQDKSLFLFKIIKQLLET